MSRFLHVEFDILLCRVQSMLQIGENQKSILFFCPNYGILKKVKTSHENEKMAVKEI